MDTELKEILIDSKQGQEELFQNVKDLKQGQEKLYKG